MSNIRQALWPAPSTMWSLRDLLNLLCIKHCHLKNVKFPEEQMEA